MKYIEIWVIYNYIYMHCKALNEQSGNSTSKASARLAASLLPFLARHCETSQDIATRSERDLFQGTSGLGTLKLWPN